MPSRRALDPARDRRQRRPHQQRRRQQERDRGAAQCGHREQDQQAERADPELQLRVDAERMPVHRHESPEQEASGAHAAHECGQEYPQRDSGGANDQLEQLEPDNLVN